MAGTWVLADVNKSDLRPGLFVNFEAEAKALIVGGITGVVGVIGEAAWGPDEVVQKIITEQDLINFYTKVETGTFDLPFLISQILLGGAKEVLAFRIEGASAAKATLILKDTTGTPVDIITLNGKYNGARGNNFTVTIAANPNNANRKDITILESGVELRKFTTRVDDGVSGMVDDTVKLINDDTGNHYVVASKLAVGNETFANIAAVSMASGADGSSPIAADYDLGMDALELEDFAFFVVDTQDATILTNLTTWIKTDLRAAGKKVIWVTGSDTGDAVSAALSDAQGYNHEGIVHVFPGFKYKDFDSVVQTARGSKAAARIAGLIAGKNLNESITFSQMSGFEGIETKLTNTQIKSLLDAGIVVLTFANGNIRVERGINTLTTLGSTQSSQFKKIQIIKILDGLENSISKTIADNIIGVFLNNSDGQNALLSLIRDFLDTLSNQGVIGSTFTVTLDTQNPPIEDKVFISITITPVDSLEFIFVTIAVNK